MCLDTPLHGNNARGAKYAVYYVSVATHTVFKNIKWLCSELCQIRNVAVPSLACLFPDFIIISKRSKGLLAYVFFSACAKWQFFWGRRFILPCQDEYLKTHRKFTFGTSRHRMTTWSYKCSPLWHTHTTKVHNPLVFTEESKPTCVWGLKVKESDSRKKMIKVYTMCTRKLVLGCCIKYRLFISKEFHLLQDPVSMAIPGISDH